LFATLLGLAIQMQGAKSFAGMTVVAIATAVGILLLGRHWRRRGTTDTPGLMSNSAEQG
jgi:hypothetical protein